MAHDALLVPRRVAQWKVQGGMYADGRFYQGAEDRLLYGVIPSADYSHGGIYFTGASMTERSLMIWDWPADEQKLVHNYCIAAANHSEQALLIRYLVEHQNLLQAGGAKTVICTELAFGDASQSKTREFVEIDTIWKSFFEHYGLYRVDTAAGIQTAGPVGFSRSARLMEIRTNLFWNWAEQFAHLSVSNPSVIAGNKMEPAEARDYWSRRMGPDWEAAMDDQLRQYADLIDFLHSKQVTVVGIRMPQGSWFEHFPQAVRYREKVLPLLARKGVELVDLSHAADDADFADASHLNYQGAVKIQPALRAVAEKYIREKFE
jgi:hypothetical protein